MPDKTELMARLSAGGAKAARSLGLLSDADMNIGNANDLVATGEIITSPIPNPPRILNLNADSKHATMVTVALAAKTNIDTSIAANSLAGPLTAILEFGNGGVFTLVEIDVPTGMIEDITIPSSANDGVMIASVPAGTLRVYGRHDGNLITPSFLNAFGSPTAIAGQANQPRAIGPWNGSTTPPTPASMKAMAVYNPWTLARRNTKTVWVYNNLTVPATVNGAYWIPALARSVQVFRNTAASAVAPTTVTLSFFDSFLSIVLEQYTIPAGTNSPIFPLPGNAMMIGVQTSADINALCLVFEIAI